jgi:hypothetical protein
MDMINLLNTDTLRLILISALDVGVILVCKRWCDIIVSSAADVIQARAEHHNLSRCPASLYPKLTQMQMIRVPCEIATARGVVCVKNYKHRDMSWSHVYRVICGLYSGAKVEPQWHMYGEDAYFNYMFDHFEQYRYHLAMTYGVPLGCPSPINEWRMPSNKAVVKSLRRHLFVYYMSRSDCKSLMYAERDDAPADLESIIEASYINYLFEVD